MCFLRIKPALDKALRKNTKKIELTPHTKIVIFSDLHRGVGDWADDFMHNSLIFATALSHYYENGFTYVELGDGDELYENHKLVDIVRAHGPIFRLMNTFHQAGRLCYILGNHNLQMGDEKWLSVALLEARTHIPGLFTGIEIFETALLGENIFLFHGHQGDLINDSLAPVGRGFVRCFWRPLQNIFGWKDPTSPAQRATKRNKVEQGLWEWAKLNHMVAIAGHTHRPMFLSLSKQQKELGGAEHPYYFNSGSGVHPRCVTGLEIKEMTIELVKWHITTDSTDHRYMRVKRELVPGCSADLNSILASV